RDHPQQAREDPHEVSGRTRQGPHGEIHAARTREHEAHAREPRAVSFSIGRIPFDRTDVDDWGHDHPDFTNWPVVYVLDGTGPRRRLYVGETTSAHKRMRQHLAGPKRQENLTDIRVVVDERYNTSACRDLESHLIRSEEHTSELQS